MVVIRVHKNLYFDFDLPKDVDENYESLTENKIKNEIEKLLSKCKYWNNIQEYEKQQNE